MDLAAIRKDARWQISKQLTTTEYSDADLDFNINLWQDKVLSWIIPAQDNWQISAQPMFLDAKKDVITYQTPTTQRLVRIYRVEYKASNAGEYRLCRVIDEQRIENWTEGNTTRTIDNATYPTVEFFGPYMNLRPAPIEDVVNGIRITVQLSSIDLDIVTNKIPELVRPVHRILSMGAALDFAMSLSMESKIRKLKAAIYGDLSVRDDKGIKGEIETIYSNHGSAFRPRLGVRRSNFK